MLPLRPSLRACNVHVQLLSAFDDLESIERSRRRAGDVESRLVIDALMAGANKLLPLFIPGHETSQICAASGKGRDASLGLQDKNLLAAEVHSHGLVDRDVRFRAQEHRFISFRLLSRHEKLRESKAEKTHSKQHTEPHHRLTQKSPPTHVVMNNRHRRSFSGIRNSPALRAGPGPGAWMPHLRRREPATSRRAPSIRENSWLPRTRRPPPH